MTTIPLDYSCDYFEISITCPSRLRQFDIFFVDNLYQYKKICETRKELGLRHNPVTRLMCWSVEGILGSVDKEILFPLFLSLGVLRNFFHKVKKSL